MPGAFFLERVRDNAQAARWRARAPPAVTHRKDARPARVLGAVAEAWRGRACLSAPSAIEKASAKASLYALVTLRRDHAGGKQ